MEREADGHFRVFDDGARAGGRYWFRLDGDRLRPDPASRFQPDGPHGPSAIVDPAAFRVDRRGWHGADADGQVIYELHVGTFTPEGTWARGRARSSPELARHRHHRDRGDAGRRVSRPLRLGLRRRRPVRADAALRHARRLARASSTARTRSGLGVILDVVYNHLGPDGNYLARVLAATTSPTATRTNGARRSTSTATDAAPVREFFIANAGYWIDEFHLDGLRLDATQSIFDDSPRARPRRRSARAARAAAGGRAIIVVAENEPQDTRLVAAAASRAATASTRCGTTTSTTRAMVALTGRSEAYYTRLPRHAAGVHLGARSTATCTRASATPGRSSARGTPALDLAAAGLRHLPRRTTTRSRTRRAAARLHQLTSARPATAR